MNTSLQSIAVFGASGKTGQAIITEARVRGIQVQVAKQRSPSVEDLKKIIQGTGAVIIVFGPRPPYTDIFCERETKHIIETMNEVGVKRLLCQTGAMIGEYPQNRSFLFQLMSQQYKRQNPQGYDDRVKQEQAVMTSDLDWTLMKPPRLTEHTTKKKIQVGEHVRVGLFSSLSRKDLATCILNEVKKPLYKRRIVFLRNI